MNKKTRSVLLILLLATLCLLIFAACNNKPTYYDEPEEVLGVMGKLVKWMRSWVGNYGWTVVVFTVFLKLIMLPLDFWQRYASRKSSLKMQRMQPIIESIDKRYGANTQRANEEKQKLYKKQGFSMLSSCLPMVVSMAIFFVMFAGLRNYSTYSNLSNFQYLSEVYYSNYELEIKSNPELKEAYEKGIGGDYHGYDYTWEHRDTNKTDTENKLISRNEGIKAAQQVNLEACKAAETKALEAVKEEYKKTHESWLWIQNVWQPDTWATIMQPYEGNAFAGNGFIGTVSMENYLSDEGRATYNVIRDAVLQTGGYGENGAWNGLMIFPVLSVGLSFLSMFISQRLERKNRKGEVVEQNAQQKTTNMMMMIMMPLMMAYFGFIYTGAFAIYMVVNYTLSIITTIAMRYPVEKFVNKRLDKEEKKNKSGKATYLR